MKKVLLFCFRPFYLMYVLYWHLRNVRTWGPPKAASRSVSARTPTATARVTYSETLRKGVLVLTVFRGVQGSTWSARTTFAEQWSCRVNDVLVADSVEGRGPLGSVATVLDASDAPRRRGNVGAEEERLSI